MALGVILLDFVSPILEALHPFMPGETFPAFFSLEMFQRSLIAALIVTVISGLIGSFLLIRNLALIGDGLAHVSFGGIAVGIVLGTSSPLWYALMFSIISSIMIYEMEERELLSGDASIAIFLTGMLAMGLVVLRIWGGGITSAPFNSSEKFIVERFPETFIFAPILLSSGTCIKRFSNMVSDIFDRPSALHIIAIN